MRIYLIGYMGSGKTTIGKMVADRMKMRFIDLDEIIEKEAGMPIPQIFDEMGEEKFRLMEQKELKKTGKLYNSIISTGGGAPCFFDNMDFMKKKGHTIYIDLTARELSDRLKTTRLEKRPLLAGVPFDKLESHIAAGLEKRLPFYYRASLLVRGSDEEIEETIVSYINSEIEIKNSSE